MKNTFFLLSLTLAVSLLPADAATISLSVNSPAGVGSPFDVRVEATNVFDGRLAGDTLVAYGFNVTIGNDTIFSYTGETAGALFDDVSSLFSGSPMVAGIAMSLAGVGPLDFVDPLTLAILHFTALKPGTTTIGITWDSTDLNQGLVYANLPYGALAASTSVTAATPEPGSLAMAGFAAVALCIVRLRRASVN